MTTTTVQTRRILVVDDEPLVRDCLRMFLRFDGHEVETASSGKDALSLLENVKFDLIITDYAMPVMKGDELASAIKERIPAQPIIMVTAYAASLQSHDNPFTAVDLIIGKPFDLQDLRAAMTRVLSAV